MKGFRLFKGRQTLCFDMKVESLDNGGRVHMLMGTVPREIASDFTIE